jgi:hypothetical protein
MSPLTPARTTHRYRNATQANTSTTSASCTTNEGRPCERRRTSVTTTTTTAPAPAAASDCSQGGTRELTATIPQEIDRGKDEGNEQGRGSREEQQTKGGGKPDEREGNDEEEENENRRGGDSRAQRGVRGKHGRRQHPPPPLQATARRAGLRMQWPRHHGDEPSRLLPLSPPSLHLARRGGG